MSVWVAGVGGTLGAAVAAALEAAGVPFVGTTRDRIDVTDAAQVSAFADQGGFRHVINCTAYTDVDGAERDREAAAAVNEHGVANLATAAWGTGAALVHVSTDYVFDGKASEPYPEDAPCRPLNAYGATKRAGERALERVLGGYDRLAAAAYVVRTSWLFGPRGHDFVGRMFRLLRERDEVDVVTDQTGRPTYAPDLAAALLRLAGITGRSAPSGIYHFANAGETTWFELTKFLAVLSGAHCRINPIRSADLKRAATRPAYSVLSTDKLTAAIDLEPRPWTEALGECLEKLMGI